MYLLLGDVKGEVVAPTEQLAKALQIFTDVWIDVTKEGQSFRIIM